MLIFFRTCSYFSKLSRFDRKSSQNFHFLIILRFLWNSDEIFFRFTQFIESQTKNQFNFLNFRKFSNIPMHTMSNMKEQKNHFEVHATFLHASISFSLYFKLKQIFFKFSLKNFSHTKLFFLKIFPIKFKYMKLFVYHVFIEFNKTIKIIFLYIHFYFLFSFFITALRFDTKEY